MALENFRYLIVDLMQIPRKENFLTKSVFFNECYKRSVVEKNLPVQFIFHSVYLTMILLLIEKIYLFVANLDELEMIILMDAYKMIQINSYLNLIHISIILDGVYVYYVFYIAIDDYYTFHLNAVLNDDCTALFGTDYVYDGHLATRYVRMKMQIVLDWIYFPDLTSGL